MRTSSTRLGERSASPTQRLRRGRQSRTATATANTSLPQTSRRFSTSTSFFGLRVQRPRFVHQHHRDVVLDVVNQTAPEAVDLVLLLVELQLSPTFRASQDLLEVRMQGHDLAEYLRSESTSSPLPLDPPDHLTG